LEENWVILFGGNSESQTLIGEEAPKGTLGQKVFSDRVIDSLNCLVMIVQMQWTLSKCFRAS